MSPRTLTGLSFKPDLVWGKARNAVDSSWLFDNIR